MIPKPAATTESRHTVASTPLAKLDEQPRRYPLQGWLWVPILIFFVILFSENAWVIASAPTDVTRYECYGLTFWLGSSGAHLAPQGWCAFLNLNKMPPQPAFHLLPIEYPPLTVVFFSLPLALPIPYYTLDFGLLVLLAACLIFWLLIRAGVRWSVLLFPLALLMGELGMVQERFDMFPAACTLICLLAAERGRWRTAYVALAVGVLLKFYPLVILPALFLAEQRAWLARQEFVAGGDSWLARGWQNVKRWRWRNSLLFAGLIIVVMGFFALLNVQEAIYRPLEYLLRRPPEIESLVSTVIWAGSHFGWSYTPNFVYGSYSLSSALSNWVSPIDTLLLFVGFLWVFWLQWRKRINLAQAMVGLLCVLITMSKVFSPQYLIWVFPLLAYLCARGQARLYWLVGWGIIALLTNIIYIGYYSQLSDPQTVQATLLALPGFFQMLAVRNLLLLAVTLAFLGNWWGTRATRPLKSWDALAWWEKVTHRNEIDS